MRAVVQRVTEAGVSVEGEPVAAIGRTVREGVFRAMMQVRLVNDGPVTLLLDSRRGF